MFDNDLFLWITAVDIPIIGSLFFLIWRVKRETESRAQHLSSMLDTRSSQLRESLAAYKLEVAKSYAAGSEVKDLENRLIGHLLRIEAKLDTTALKTEALRAETKSHQ